MKRMIKLENDIPGVGRAGETVDWDRVRLELTPADVHVPEELPNYLAGYRNWEFRAVEATGTVSVDHDVFIYRTFSEDDVFEPVNVKGANTGPIPEVDVRSSTAQGRVIDRFIGCFIPARTGQEARSNYRPEQRGAKRCGHVLEMDLEIDVWANMLGVNTSYASAQRLALGAGENWNGGAASDPIKNLQTVQENSDQPVTDFWMNRKVANGMLRHDKVRDYLKMHIGDQAATNLAAGASQAANFQLPGLPPIHVLEAKYKPSATKVYFLPDVVVGTTSTGTPTDGESVSTIKLFRRAGVSGVGFDVEQFFFRGRGPKGGTMVVVSTGDVPIITASNAGGHIAGVWA